MDNNTILNGLDESPAIAELTALANKAELAQSEDRAFMEPKPLKRARGRPKKDKTEDKTDSQKAGPDIKEGPGMAPDPMLEMLAQSMVKTISSTVAAMTTVPECAMTSEEMASGSAILAALGAKYAPDVFTKYGLEVTALTIFGMYFWRVKTTTDGVIEARIRERNRRENELARETENKEHVQAQAYNGQNAHFPQAVN